MGFSLRELSALSGLTAGFLSQVENDRVSPSLNSLQRIATALEVPMFNFLHHAEQFDPVVRAGRRRRMNFSDPHMGYDLLSPELNRAMMSILIRMEPGARRVAAPLSKPTEQWMYVLQGRLSIQVAGRTHVLEPGDSIYYDGNALTEFSSTGADELNVICCMTPPAL
jgi:transcriptional regulator with XRE-family HTH domain